MSETKVKQSKVQAILFDNKKWNTSRARNWLKRHNYEAIKRVHKTDNMLRYRIKNPDKFNKFRTLKLGKDIGIEFILGYKAKNKKVNE